jgi:N-acetylglutamate synthase-like GNAT family acetyltransferase
VNTESLSFTVRLVASDAELALACQVRAAAYGRDLPQLGASMLQPDALDRAADTLVLLARDKQSGRAVGTARICTNRHGPLLIEQCFVLPAEFAGKRLGEVTRLAVHPDNVDPALRMSLLKAVFLAARARGIDEIVVGVRRPGLVRNYRHLGFRDLHPEPVPLSYAGGLPHHMMSFNVRDLEQTWRTSGHRLYAWGIETEHPDICVDPA